MLVEVWGMTCAGVAALIAGFILVMPRFRAESGAGKALVLGPTFVGASLGVFAAEHFTAARDLMSIVPHWLPFPLFWTYFVGTCLLAAAISFIAWRHVRWSASLLALLFIIIVVTVDLPNLTRGMHNRFFWILTVRELSFGGGAMVLAGNLGAGRVLIAVGRGIVGIVMVFYGIEHFLFPRNVTGVPLEKLTPAWVPAPTLIAYLVGITLVLAGAGLFVRRTTPIAAAFAGVVLVLLTVCFYVPIAVTELNTPLAVEGLNYIFDTLLFAGTVLLAGLGAESSGVVPLAQSRTAEISAV